jgi:hypothetical protein
MNPSINQKIQNGESFIVANDGQYLGKLTLNKFDRDSIANEYGNYGSKYSNSSIFNRYCNYGSPYSSLSPYNIFTSTPPVIYLKGRKYGLLTKNKYAGFNSTDPDELFALLTKLGLNF